MMPRLRFPYYLMPPPLRAAYLYTLFCYCHAAFDAATLFFFRCHDTSAMLFAMRHYALLPLFNAMPHAIAATGCRHTYHWYR